MAVQTVGPDVAVQTVGPDVRALHRGFGQARQRFWWERGLSAMAQGLCVALGFGLAAALLASWQAPKSLEEGLWAAGGVALLAGLVAALLARPSSSHAARAVDHRLGLRQQFGTAEELLARRAEGSLVRYQIAAASELAGEVPIARAFHLLPRRELTLALPLAAATAVVLVLASLGIRLPNPLTAIHLPSWSQQAAALVVEEEETAGARREPNSSRPRSPAIQPVQRIIDDLQSRALAGAISPAAAAAALAQASGELNRVANESRQRQEALENLASELRATAAGRDAAESLRQGDFDGAARQLQELGRQSDQLSPSAKRDLAEALKRAAARSPGAHDLARTENRAAQDLQRNDYASTVQSMDRLAKSVQEASQQMVSQGELAETWQQLEALNQQLGGLGLQKDQEGGLLSPPVAQAPQGAGERSAGMPLGAPGDEQPGDAGQGVQDPMAGGLAQQGAGTPGNTRGGPPLGNPNPRLGPDGNPLEVEGKVGDRFPGEGQAGSQPPSVLREGKANSDLSSSGQGADGPLSVPAENVVVPGDRRPVVRDYFSGGGR